MSQSCFKPCVSVKSIHVSHLFICRRGGALPDGASAAAGKLVFGRALRLNDSGVYECVVKNNVGVGKTEYVMTVTGKWLICF